MECVRCSSCVNVRVFRAKAPPHQRHFGILKRHLFLVMIAGPSETFNFHRHMSSAEGFERQRYGPWSNWRGILRVLWKCLEATARARDTNSCSPGRISPSGMSSPCLHVAQTRTSMSDDVSEGCSVLFVLSVIRRLNNVPKQHVISRDKALWKEKALTHLQHTRPAWVSSVLAGLPACRIRLWPLHLCTFPSFQKKKTVARRSFLVTVAGAAAL